MSTNTANMSLILPDVGGTAGPTFAEDINASLTLVDQHDHSIGKGVQITPAGMNINSSLDFGGNFATNLAGLTLSAQGSAPANGTVYESGNDLYFVDGVGNDVRITQSGAVAGTPGSIANLVPPASASYVGASSKFVWQSDTNIAADMDAGSVLIREKVASAKAITLSSPTGLAADYALTLMGSLPGSSKFLSISSAGAIASDWAVDNSTIEVNTNVVQIKDLGVSTAKLAAGAVTKAKLAALGQQTSSSSGSFTGVATSLADVTNLTVSITTTGRSVIAKLVATPAFSNASIGCSSSSTANIFSEFVILRDSTVVGSALIQIAAAATGGLVVASGGPSQLEAFDPAPAAGTYTYKVQYLSNTSTTTTFVTRCTLIVYEI